MSTDDKQTSPPIEPGTGYTKQAFLIGEGVYLRPITKDDAKVAASWRATPFPKSTDLTETWIDEELKDDKIVQLLIVRKSDDRIIGSVTCEAWDHWSHISWFSDPALRGGADALIGEGLVLVADWRVTEHAFPVTMIEKVPADRPGIWQTLEAAGLTRSAAFSEAITRGSHRVDAYVYEQLHPFWVKTLGNPADEPLERSGTGEPRPVTAPVAVEGKLPHGAIRVGPRVYLRALEKADAEMLVEWSRRENDATWDNGRWIYTAIAQVQRQEKQQEKKLPDNLSFAVCLREGDVYIGTVSITGIDFINGIGESESAFHVPGYRGGGYGSEAKHLLFDYAFNTLGLHALHSWVMYTNTRSAAALLKQGYTQAGRCSWLVHDNGTYRNFGLYELMADRWRAMPRG